MEVQERGPVHASQLRVWLRGPVGQVYVGGHGRSADADALTSGAMGDVPFLCQRCEQHTTPIRCAISPLCFLSKKDGTRTQRRQNICDLDQSSKSPRTSDGGSCAGGLMLGELISGGHTAQHGGARGVTEPPRTGERGMTGGGRHLGGVDLLSCVI